MNNAAKILRNGLAGGDGTLMCRQAAGEGLKYRPRLAPLAAAGTL
jgi:hypothetical protein